MSDVFASFKHPRSGKTHAEVEEILRRLDAYLEGTFDDGTYQLGSDSLGIDWKALNPLSARSLQKQYEMQRRELEEIRERARRPRRPLDVFLQ